MTINTPVIILRGALSGVDGHIIAIHESGNEVEIQVDFLSSVITDMSNVRELQILGEQTKTPEVSSEVQH
jgi:hypothetical protein